MLKVLGTVRPYNLTIAAALINAALDLKLPDMVITVGTDGKHMVGSYHYKGDALDIRTKHLSLTEKRALAKNMAQRLGTDYDVILEGLGTANEHLHVERDTD